MIKEAISGLYLYKRAQNNKGTEEQENKTVQSYLSDGSISNAEMSEKKKYTAAMLNTDLNLTDILCGGSKNQTGAQSSPTGTPVIPHIC